MSKLRGFTIIELLVTISIIAVLSVIGLIVYTDTMKKGRDARRNSDLRSIQSALEQYFADQFFYPFALPSPGNSLTSSTGNPSPPASPRVYMNTLPSASPQYIYTALPDSPSACNNDANKCRSYCLYAGLENPPSPLPSAPSGCTYPAGGYNTAVTPP